MARYQQGDLIKRKRKRGPDIWQFRWVENGRRKSMIIGTVEELRTKGDRERAVEHLRMKANAQNLRQNLWTVGGLIGRFMEEYAPRHCRRNTQNNYRGIFKNHIRPRWEDETVQGVKTMAIESWLDEYPHSRQVKSHIRNLMHTLFNAALRWEMVDRNPVDLVRQSAKRLKAPRVLTPEQFNALVAELEEPYKTMVITAGCLGLRVSELVAMKWADLDFQELTITIQRGFVRGEINPTKTEASEGTLPLDPDLAELLLKHKTRQDGQGSNDWVFASINGQPRWPESMLRQRIKPAASRAGIGNVGWHTFRHTYSTLLHALGTTPAVQKELLRHANIQTTLNVYTRAVSEEKRSAASKVAQMLVLGGTHSAGGSAAIN